METCTKTYAYRGEHCATFTDRRTTPIIINGRVYLDMDIKTALFSIPNIKSPGPDGFNSGFFKHTWHKLGTLGMPGLIWARPNMPRNAFISWVLINHRLLIKQRLAKFQPQSDTLCVMCSAEEENEDHLFYACSYAQAIRDQLRQWWNQIPTVQQVTSAIIIAIFYHIWIARNHRIFRKKQITSCQTAYLIKDQVSSRILFLKTYSKKFSSCVDSLLN
ncbi:hypothetical protein Cgig2_031348 [Carnegiea gigantea]|uniref:Reverse transcriptase zinc-binding domain-containing protein n=1 Tax=Carnegiea gigantea TaxID=171969 RepID=A0A9Q1GJM8_9CARY|nr:hypothetical protein Cgig2_031348 [Carnegiea gigantea]